jgi:predicted amidohydrolase YtcJ
MGSTKAGLVLRNANLITLDPRHPGGSTLYIGDERIVKVSNSGMERSMLAHAAEVIDCAGRTVIPSFHDAHCHIVSYAESLINIDLSPASVTSIEDIVEKIRVAASSTPAGHWIRCAGYNEFYLREQRHPTRQDLDRATTLHPVKMTHRSGHAHVLNSGAMTITGITNETEELPGGMIERDLESGEPNGLLYGMGPYLNGLIPPISDEELAGAISKAGRTLLSLGITSVQDASPGNGMQRWQQFVEWKEMGLFDLRTVLMFNPAKSEHVPLLDKKNRLSTGAVKIVLDEVRGSLNPPQDELNATAALIHGKDLQMAIHAVEEGTVDAAVNALSYAQAKYPHRSRHRIEHCSICTPSTARRLASLGAMVVTNPGFIYESGERYRATVPASQREHLYAINTMLGAGLKVAAGSDSPVARPDPLTGIYAAVARRAATGRDVLAGEAIPVTEALKLYALNAAYSCFQESQLGNLMAGKYADLVVLNGDPLKVPAEDIKSLTVDMTFLAGKLVYQRSG